MAKYLQPQDDQQPEIPNESVRKVIDIHNLGFIQHVDFDSSLVCRGMTMRRKTGFKNVICSPDSSCVIAHKGTYKYLWNAEEGNDEEGDNEEGDDKGGDR